MLFVNLLSLPLPSLFKAVLLVFLYHVTSMFHKYVHNLDGGSNLNGCSSISTVYINYISVSKIFGNFDSIFFT